MFVRERISLHLDAEDYGDWDLPLCTLSDKWQNPPTYSVVNKETNYTWRTKGTKEEAEECLRELSEDKRRNYQVVMRPSLPIRCVGWCDARPFCNQYQEESQA